MSCESESRTLHLIVCYFVKRLQMSSSEVILINKTLFLWSPIQIDKFWMISPRVVKYITCTHICIIVGTSPYSACYRLLVYMNICLHRGSMVNMENLKSATPDSKSGSSTCYWERSNLVNLYLCFLIDKLCVTIPQLHTFLIWIRMR